MEQTNNVVGNFRVSIGGVIITFNVMDNPETIVNDLAKANAICDNVLSNLGAPTLLPVAVAKSSKAEIEQVVLNEKVKPNIKGGKQAEVTVAKEAEPVVVMVSNAKSTTQVAHAAEINISDTVSVVEAEPVYTLADMRKLLGEIIDLGHRPAAEQYVQYHCKTKRTSEIPVEKYPAIMRDLTDLAAGLKAGAYNGYDDFAKAKGYELSTDGQE